MASAGKPGIISSLENVGKISPEKVQNPEAAPDLQSDKNFQELSHQARKRRKSFDSPPNNQPSSKRKGTLPPSKASGSEEFRGQTREEEGTAPSEVIGSKEYTDLSAVDRFNPNQTDVWEPCQDWVVVTVTTTWKKCYNSTGFTHIWS